MHFSLYFDFQKFIDKPEILFLRGFYLLKFSNQSMKWTYDHNVIFVREILHLALWLHKYGTTERGELLSKIADKLIAVKNQALKSLRGQLETGIHTWKKPQDQSRTRGTSKWDLPRRI